MQGTKRDDRSACCIFSRALAPCTNVSNLDFWNRKRSGVIGIPALLQFPPGVFFKDIKNC